MTQAPLIPRRTFFSNPDHLNVQVSPDGKWLVYAAPLDGVLNLWLAPWEKPLEKTPLTHDKGRGVRSYMWSYTGEHLVYLQDQDGDENWAVYSLNVRTKEVVALSPTKGVHASITAASPRCEGEILISLNDRDPSHHDVYRVDVRTGKRTLVFQNDQGYAGFLCDRDLRCRYAFEALPDGGGRYLDVSAPEAPQEFLTLSPDDVMTTSLVGFDGDQTHLYMVDSRGRDTAALMKYCLATQKLTLLAEDARADMEDILLHPETKALWGAAANYDRKAWQFFDPTIEEEIAYLKTQAEGDLEVTSLSYDARRWVVVFAQDRAAHLYYTYDRDAKKVSFLFSSRKALDGLDLARMHPCLIKARDGLTLVSYLTLPVGSSKDDGITPGRPLPLILEIHGGPRARERWGYNPLHQWLANRGYAVLSVNYRASTGFGKRFIHAGNGEWAGKMHEDLLDAAKWAVDQGITTADQICIMGGSYGGYAALVGLSMTPNVFACGVDIVGPSNLLTLIESIPPYWKPVLDIMRVMLGADPATPEGQAFLKERSPLTHCDKICKPLLIAQGANDPRVKQAESDQIVSALQEKKIPVTYALYPDEGHGFVRPENKLSFYAITEAFLAQVLKGRCEEVGKDFEGSSVQLLAGREHIEEVHNYLGAASQG